MARTISVLNRKGGVGKTTTALCLHDALVRKGYKTLMVDLDAQHNATRQFGARMDSFATVFDILTETSVEVAEAIQDTPAGFIIAGDDLLNGIENEMARILSKETMLADGLSQVADDFDFIVIDCPPALGTLAVNALVASDYVLVPMLCEIYCLDGFSALNQLISQIKQNRRLNPNLEVLGIVVTQYEARQNLVKKFDEELPNIASSFNTHVFDTRIRRCCKVKEAQAQNVSLLDYDNSCTTAQDYLELTDEIVNRIQA